MVTTTQNGFQPSPHQPQPGDVDGLAVHRMRHRLVHDLHLAGLWDLDQLGHHLHPVLVDHLARNKKRDFEVKMRGICMMMYTPDIYIYILMFMCIYIYI